MEKNYLVVRKFLDEPEGENRVNSLMTADELIHYIDFQDIYDEHYNLYEILSTGEVVPIHYVGWQPDCLIEFKDEKGEVVLSGYGTDH